MTRSNRLRITIALTALVAGAGLAAVGSLAFAKSTTTLQTAHNASLGETVVVNTRGRTLYKLSPETAHHLLCKSSQCFMFWPPLKVSKNAKLTAAHGIKGKLGKIHRNGFYQVTLGGDPLYTFAEDQGKGQANGNGIKSFGGTWHVLTTSTAKHTPTTTTTMSTTTSSTTTSTYSYPIY
jgi:predicted lipoprotein with Yx(FWY)xxD motif